MIGPYASINVHYARGERAGKGLGFDTTALPWGVTRRFVPKTFPIQDDSYPGRFVPKTIRTQPADVSYLRTFCTQSRCFVPTNKSFHGTKLDNKKNFHGTKLETNKSFHGTKLDNKKKFS